MKLRLSLRDVSIVLATLFVTSALLVTYVAPQAGADHEPANKVAAAGSATEVFGPGEEVVILSERVRVSSNADLILNLSAECDILTRLTTGGAGISQETQRASGEILTWIEIDGTPVKVSTDDDESGRVVLCNRSHEKSITDTEDGDDTDEEREMTQTRQANGFNWLALDTGFVYDSPANGNNILDIVVKATLTETPQSERSQAEALIGHRTLIVEPTNASVHEMVNPTEPEPSPSQS